MPSEMDKRHDPGVLACSWEIKAIKQTSYSVAMLSVRTCSRAQMVTN
jgi:hypothetical protein